MSEILTESYCERCGAQFTFESAAPTNSPLTRARTLARGVRNYLTSDESLDEALAEARRERERQASGIQLQAFHDTFSFCFSCRQYTCRDCWNEAAGRCRTCAPMPDVPDPLEQRELQAALSRLEAIGEPAPAPAAEPEPAVLEELAPPSPGEAAQPGVLEAPAGPAPEMELATAVVAEQEAGAPVAIEAPVEAAPPTEVAATVRAQAPAEAMPSIGAEAPSEVAPSAEVATFAAVELEALPEVLPAPEVTIEPRAEVMVAAEEAVTGEAETEAPSEPTPLAADQPLPARLPQAPALPRPPRAPLHPPQPPAPGTAPWQIVAPDETPAVPVGWPPTPEARPRDRRTSVSGAAIRLQQRAENPNPQVSPRITRSVWEESTRDVVARPGSGIQACTGCGLPLSASARFCRRCGARQA